MTGEHRDIDMVVITGAGASATLGVDGTLPMMREWSNALVKEINGLGQGRREATGLELDLGPEQFEERLGHFIRSVNAFNQVKSLIRPSADFQGYGPTQQNIDASTLDQWYLGTSHHLRAIINAINKTLYDLFGEMRIDQSKAVRAYGDLFRQLGIQAAGSRWIYATTNYDTIGETVIHELGGMPDWGQPPPIDFRNERKLDVSRLIDGMPRYVPVLHLHGRIGWFRREENGEIYGSSSRYYDEGFGTPIVMLPDPQKDYGSDTVIQSIWLQFEETLERARRVFVLGHSLHDSALVEALKTHVQPASRLAVSVFAPEDPTAPLESDSRAVADVVQKELRATAVPMRFGQPTAHAAEVIETWLRTDLPEAS